MKSAGPPHAKVSTKAPTEVSTKEPTGIAGFDEITAGNLPRGRTTLLVGGPGSGKTLFSLHFLMHGVRDCKEPGIFVAFEEGSRRIIADTKSSNWKLEELVQRKKRHFMGAQPTPDLIQSGSFDLNGMLAALTAQVESMGAKRKHKACCLVIDPVSTLAKTGNELTAHGVAERLIDWSKADATTLVCTSLLDEMTNQEGGTTPLQISTLADTWIHLNYRVQAGERNRSLSIVKSRGTKHSNQVREPILSNEGVTLADIYTAGGEVLMGTMRWEKENAERVANEVAEVAGKLKRVTLDAEEAVLEVRAKAVQTELLAKQVEKTLLERTTASRHGKLSRGHTRIRELRGGDAAKPGQKRRTR
jgi:circadian clock protein KaiC